MEPFIGQLALFGFNFAPRGWAFCNGQLLSIAENTALFSLLGTTYGGDGRTTFALPDLRGRSPVHFGQGTGLSYRVLGEMEGAESVTLGVAQLPSHSHALLASSSAPDSASPAGGVLPTFDADQIYTSGSPNVAMNTGMVGSAGGGQPVSIMPPFLAMNWCIALQGVFPSRS